MSLQFDGNGIVSIPAFTTSGDFTITGTFTYQNTSSIIIGDNTSNGNFLACLGGNIIRTRINGTTLDHSGSFTNGQVINFSWSRSNGNITLTVNTVSVGQFNSAAFRIDTFGAYNAGALKYSGVTSGTWTFTDGTTARSYDMGQPQGNTVLPDSISSLDGTLSGFTTGGFEGTNNSITIDNVNYEFKQQVSGTANHTLSGTYTGTPTTIEYQVGAGSWTVGDASPTGGTFSFSVPVPTGESTVSARFSNDTPISDSVQLVTCDVFVCAGQSNMSGRGNNNQTYTQTGGVKAYLFGNDDNYKLLVDPYDSNSGQVDSISSDSNAAGSWIVRFAHHWILNEGTPCAFIPCAKGGTTISQWQKGQPLYTSMDRRINLIGNVRAVLFELGETDSGSTGTLRSTYETQLGQMADDINTDFGCEIFIVPLHTITSAGYDGDGVTTGQAAIRAGQIAAADSNANVRIGQPLTDIDISDADGLHFQNDDELETVASRMYASFSGNISTANITISGIPDGTFLTTLLTADRPSTLITSENLTYTSGTSSILLTKPVGTVVYGLARDSLDPSDVGVAIKTVTV